MKINNTVKIIIIITALTLSLAVLTGSVFSQNYLDISKFINVNNGYWLLNSDNTGVTQLYKYSTDYYYLYDKVIKNKIIKGKLKVDSINYDNDTFGLVFGYKNINDSYIFSWDQGGIHGPGQLFYHKNRDFDHREIPGDILHDGRASGRGWETGQEYTFKATYLENNFSLSINGREVINVAGNFPPGKFGFFCFSQGYVNFSDIEILPADHLVVPPRPPLEEMEEPIIIRNDQSNSGRKQFKLTKQSYQIINKSEYEIKEAYLKITLDPELQLIKDSLAISKDIGNYTLKQKENRLIITNFSLKPDQIINLGFYIQPLNNLELDKKYINKIGVYSKNNNILVSNPIKSVLEYKKKLSDYSALLIGRVNILNKDKHREVRPEIITSEGRVIQVDKLGRYHLEFNNFKSFTDTKIVVLEIKLPKRYNNYTSEGLKNKLIEIKPGQLIKQDFNIKLGGQKDG